MKLINNFIKYIVSLTLIISTMLTVIDICCFDKNFYYKQYEKNDTASIVQTDSENLSKITSNLLDYLKDKNNDINITYLKNDKEINVYQNIELIHMADVKELYQNVKIVNNILIVITLFGLFYIFINKISFHKEFNSVLFLCVVAICLIIITCIADFDNFWTYFHQIFFTKNDYWLLDPRTCILVNLFTSDFFFSLCTKICIISICIILLYFVIINYYEKKKYS